MFLIELLQRKRKEFSSIFLLGHLAFLGIFRNLLL